MMELGILVDALNSTTGTAALVLGALGGVCALVSALLPTPKEPSGIYFHVHRVVNWIGCNFGKAKNANGSARLER